MKRQKGKQKRKRKKMPKRKRKRMPKRKQKKDAEEKAKKDAEEKVRKEAEEKARREEEVKKEQEEKEEKAAQAKAAIEKAKRDKEEKDQRETEEKTKREAEEKKAAQAKSAQIALKINAAQSSPTGKQMGGMSPKNLQQAIALQAAGKRATVDNGILPSVSVGISATAPSSSPSPTNRSASVDSPPSPKVFVMPINLELKIPEVFGKGGVEITKIPTGSFASPRKVKFLLKEVKVNNTKDYVFSWESKKKAEDDAAILLSEAVLYTGHEQGMFKKDAATRKNFKAELSFTLVAPKRTLDCVCDNLQDFARVTSILRALTKKT